MNRTRQRLILRSFWEYFQRNLKTFEEESLKLLNTIYVSLFLTIRTGEHEIGQDSERQHQEDNWSWRVGGELKRVQTKMARSCYQKRRRTRGKESEKNGGWKEKEGRTEKEMGGLCQGGYGGSGSDGREGTGSSNMEEEDPHRRPQLNWEKPAEEEYFSAKAT